MFDNILQWFQAGDHLMLTGGAAVAMAIYTSTDQGKQLVQTVQSTISGWFNKTPAVPDDPSARFTINSVFDLHCSAICLAQFFQERDDVKGATLAAGIGQHAYESYLDPAKSRPLSVEK